MRDLEKLAQNLYISPATPSQRAALACFEPATLAMLEERRHAFEARRDFLVPALRELGFGDPGDADRRVLRLCRLLAPSEDSERFCREVLEGCGVAITPGLDFGRAPRRRGTCASRTRSTQAKLEDGVARLARFLRR